MSNDPWASLPTPGPAGQLSGRRVDADLPWDIFWARDHDDHPVFYLTFPVEATPDTQPPKLRGVDVQVRSDVSRGFLILTLLDAQAKDVFRALCLNIVSGTESASSEREAASVALRRTWRWHHLLRGAPDGLLSAERQKGLIGELEVLRTLMIPRLGGMDSVNSWHGPLDSPKDFEFSRSALEVKTRRGSAAPFVKISSEFQLDSDSCDRLFLAVVDISTASAGDTMGITLDQVVERTRTEIGDLSEAALEPFDGLTAAAGFDPQDDYSNQPWVVGGLNLYEVVADFPRIVPGGDLQGLSRISYSLSLASAEEYQVDESELDAAIVGGNRE